MNEKQIAFNIKKELKQATIDLNDESFTECYVCRNLKDLEKQNITIDTLISESNLLGINAEYANKMKTNKTSWLKRWNENNCLVFFLRS